MACGLARSMLHHQAKFRGDRSFRYDRDCSRLHLFFCLNVEIHWTVELNTA